VTTFVLAAGHATRLRPLSNWLPKVLFPVVNVPLLDRIVSCLQAAGATRVAVNTHHLADEIERYVSGRNYAVPVTLHHETEILGTGGGLANLRRVLRDESYVLVYNGDILTNLDLTRLVEEHVRAEADATLALVDCSRINNVAVDASGRIVRLVSGTTRSERLWAGGGIFVYSRRFIESLPERPSSVIDALKSWGEPDRVRGVVFEKNFWTDIGTPSAYLDAHNAIQCEMQRPCGVEAHVELLVVAETAQVDPSVEMEGFVSIGESAVVGRNVHLRNAILWSNARVNDGEHLRRAVVGSGVGWIEDDTVR
jgi:mannose-1-phosphate guanylyltransferase